MKKNRSIFLCFTSLFLLFMTVICLIYLLFIYSKGSPSSKKIITIVSARESPPLPAHNTLSTAYHITSSYSYHDKLSAHEKGFYYTCISKNPTITLTAKSIKKIRPKILSENAKPIAFQSVYSKNSLKIIVHPITSLAGKNLFLQLENTSSMTLSLQIRLIAPSKKNINSFNKSEKSKLSTKSKENTKSSGKKLSTKKCQNVNLNPQFMHLRVKDVHKMTLLPKSEKNADYMWISTNPKVVQIKGHKVCALSNGIAILYIQNKKTTKKSSSCLIRVYS